LLGYAGALRRSELGRLARGRLSAYPSRYDALRDPSLGDAEECCSEDAETVCPR
jgi:hypothetical protein